MGPPAHLGKHLLKDKLCLIEQGLVCYTKGFELYPPEGGMPWINEPRAHSSVQMNISPMQFSLSTPRVSTLVGIHCLGYCDSLLICLPNDLTSYQTIFKSNDFALKIIL